MASVEPKLSKLVELRHVRAQSFIGSNFSSQFVRPGEQLELSCTIEAPQRTEFVHWFKNKQPVFFEAPRVGKQSGAPARGAKLVRSNSRFAIKSVQLNDTANYTCLVSRICALWPSNYCATRLISRPQSKAGAGAGPSRAEPSLAESRRQCDNLLSRVAAAAVGPNGWRARERSKALGAN